MKLFIERDDLIFNIHFKCDLEGKEFIDFPLKSVIESKDEERFNLLINDPRFIVNEDDIEHLSSINALDDLKKKILLSKKNNYRNSEIEYETKHYDGIGEIFMVSIGEFNTKH